MRKRKEKCCPLSNQSRHRCLQKRHVSARRPCQRGKEEKVEGNRRTRFRVANRLRGDEKPLVWCILNVVRRNSNVGSNVPPTGRGDHFLFVGTASWYVEEHSATSFYQSSNTRRRSVGCIFDRWTKFTRWCQSHAIRYIMQLLRTFLLLGCCFLVLTLVTAAPAGQEEPFFELPVHLIGFPVIIASVRIANFFKKLAYILNPDTYVSRVKRAHPFTHDEEILDVGQIEKKLVTEFGNNVCIYERICVEYADRMLRRKNQQLDWSILDWGEVFSEYKSSPNLRKENYLLSIFLGNIISSPKLCHSLAERGRACDSGTLSV